MNLVGEYKRIAANLRSAAQTHTYQLTALFYEFNYDSGHQSLARFCWKASPSEHWSHLDTNISQVYEQIMSGASFSTYGLAWTTLEKCPDLDCAAAFLCQQFIFATIVVSALASLRPEYRQSCCRGVLKDLLANTAA